MLEIVNDWPVLSSLDGASSLNCPKGQLSEYIYTGKEQQGGLLTCNLRGATISAYYCNYALILIVCQRSM